MVSAIIDVARKFDIQTVAEGVESQETLDLLGELGADFAQGYHLGFPAPVDGRARALGRGQLEARVRELLGHVAQDLQHRLAGRRAVGALVAGRPHVAPRPVGQRPRPPRPGGSR